MSALVDVRCRGCGRRTGIGPRNAPTYCDDLCAADFPVSADEARDAVIAEVIVAGTMNAPTMAKALGVTRQRVQQILKDRASR